MVKCIDCRELTKVKNSNVHFCNFLGALLSPTYCKTDHHAPDKEKWCEEYESKT